MKQAAHGLWKPLLGVLLAVAPGQAAEGLSATERYFVETVQPLLKEKCHGCHSDKAKKLRGKFRLETRAQMLKGGESEKPALVPGNAEKSPLFVGVTWRDKDLQMPPKENDRLTPRHIAAIKRWIDSGAPWPDPSRQVRTWSDEATREGVMVRTSGGISPDWTYRRYRPEDLWAYRPVKRPAVPWDALPEGAARSPVDAFIHRALTAAGLAAAPPADRRTLIRRVTFDLTGLPPTPAEVDAFRADARPGAYARVVDRLLASPRHGEQMARHWLDVVRYADSAGFSNDFARPNAWRYRDYVIRSFNGDKPYDQFVREQIAGDEIDPKDPENLIAVGFLRMGPWEHTSMSVAAVTRQHFLDDITNSIGVTFLAQELRCARCHDHKFDPLPTRDYYRVQSVFAPVQFVDRALPYQPHENTAGFPEGEARIQRLLKDRGVKSLRTIPKRAWPVETYDADSEKKGHGKVGKKRREFLVRERKRYKPFAYSVYSGPDNRYRSKTLYMKMPKNRQGRPPEVRILQTGSLQAPLERVSPGVLSVVAGLAGDRTPGKSASLTAALHGRRQALADWIASPTNPLTARVMVNRVWQMHFGRGLTANSNNFGKMGGKPSHPELLEYLAARFVEWDWSLKKLHRLILLSQAYRRSGDHPRPDAVRRRDPNNRWLSRFPPRRLAAEELRDAMLAVSGELNMQMGGIPARPEIHIEIAMQPRHIMGSVGPAYQPSFTPSQRHRRTIYAERIRTLRAPFLAVFNQPGFDTSCERRDTSSVTPQVFALFNGSNARDRALAMALRLEKAGADPARQVNLSFRLAYGRTPSREEAARALAHLVKMTLHHEGHAPVKVDPPTYVVREMVEEMTGLKFYWVEDLDVYASPDFVPDKKPWDVAPRTRALADLCLVLFNSNEFIYVY